MSAYGAPDKFAFHADARLDETSPLVNEQTRERLINEWGAFWDLSSPVLLEKSPPDLIRTRFLQALFPEAYFIVVRRHPFTSSLARRDSRARNETF